MKVTDPNLDNSDLNGCTCNAHNHPSIIDGYHVHSESCPNYNH